MRWRRDSSPRRELSRRARYVVDTGAAQHAAAA